MAPITVAVAGGTGGLGKLIVQELLAPRYFPSQIGKVLVTTRDPESDSSKKVRDLGAELFAGSLDADAFRGVDVVVNATGGHPLTLDTLNPVAKAAAEAGVKVYFGSDYGCDYHSLGAGFDLHPVFQIKADAESYAHKVGGTKMKVIGLHTGAFMEAVFHIGPHVGLNYAAGQYTGVESTTTPTTLTSRGDIAKTIARLAVLAVEDPSAVPDQVRINGNAITTEQIAEAFKDEGAKTPELKTVPLAEFLGGQSLKEIPFPSYIQVLIGTGRANFSKDNNNELANPGESIWKWTKFSDVVRDMKGVMW